MDAMAYGMFITRMQIRAGRVMAGLKQSELAHEADISTTALNNIESGKSEGKVSTLKAITAALKAHNVEFTNDEAPGVRLREAKK